MMTPNFMCFCLPAYSRRLLRQTSHSLRLTHLTFFSSLAWKEEPSGFRGECEPGGSRYQNISSASGGGGGTGISPGGKGAVAGPPPGGGSLRIKTDRKSVGEGKRVDLGGRRIIKKKKRR